MKEIGELLKLLNKSIVTVLNVYFCKLLYRNFCKFLKLLFK